MQLRLLIHPPVNIHIRRSQVTADGKSASQWRNLHGAGFLEIQIMVVNTTDVVGSLSTSREHSSHVVVRYWGHARVIVL